MQVKTTKSVSRIQSSKTGVEVIKRFNPTPCYKCEGTGFAIGPGISRLKAGKKLCDVCDGTGQWNEDTYDIIATQPDGQKIAFRCDGIK